MTTDILKDWMKDLPMQFLGKKNINVLIKAFAKQMQELDVVFDELNSKTGLDTAMGQNLDYVGTIIPLTRKEAGEMAGINVDEPVISDERYRQYLRYKMLSNTSDCTYYDIMQAIELLWDVEKASYYERTDRPATIFIGLPMVSVEDDDQAQGKPSIMKPAGVGFLYTAQYWMLVDQSMLERIRVSCLDVHVWFWFFGRTLNGGWQLDGFTHLGQDSVWDMSIGIAIGSIHIHHDAGACFQELGISAAFPMVLPRNQYGMKINGRFDFSEVLAVDVENIGIDIPVYGAWETGTGSMTVKKDYWQINGQFSMDGGRIMDAEIREERL